MNEEETEYRLMLHGLTDERLQSECEKQMWMAAYAANNPRADAHWKIDQCYEECEDRDQVGKGEIYDRALKCSTGVERD